MVVLFENKRAVEGNQDKKEGVIFCWTSRYFLNIYLSCHVNIHISTYSELFWLSIIVLL